MKVPKNFICPCCSTKHSVEWATRQALKIKAMPPHFRSYGEIAFYKAARLQNIIEEKP